MALPRPRLRTSLPARAAAALAAGARHAESFALGAARLARTVAEAARERAEQSPLASRLRGLLPAGVGPSPAARRPRSPNRTDAAAGAAAPRPPRPAATVARPEAAPPPVVVPPVVVHVAGASARMAGPNDAPVARPALPALDLAAAIRIPAPPATAGHSVDATVARTAAAAMDLAAAATAAVGTPPRGVHTRTLRRRGDTEEFAVVTRQGTALTLVRGEVGTDGTAASTTYPSAAAAGLAYARACSRLRDEGFADRA